MKNRSYQYPFGGWLGRALLWLVITLIFFVLLFDVFGALSDLLACSADLWDWARLALALVLGFVFWAYATNAYPNIDVRRDGLMVEYFWKSLFITWENIVQVKEGGRAGSKTWAVQAAKGLTSLHRLYGLFYTRSLVPTFVIYSYLPDHKKLVDEIQKHLKTQTKKQP